MSAKKILVINCHPNSESFNSAIVQTYIRSAKSIGFEVESLIISELKFDPNLSYGFQKRKELEPDLLDALEKIKWADHLVWVHPVWWGGLPAIAKGFIDRLFLPGLVFKYRENSVWWDKMLTRKTAHIITTLDQPGWFYRFFYCRPSVNQLKKSTLQFCGVKPVKVSYIGPVRNSTPKQREKWLLKVEKFAY